jgi:taurine dioxygenase
MWANMATAYEALSNTMKTFVDGLHASHDFAKSFGYEKFSTTEDQNRWQRIRADYPPVVHPVVRTHPISGQKSLFVNSAFTTHIIELKSAESDEVLQFLFKHTVQPEFTLRYRWQKNDVAFWDNRITQHYALADYLPHYRCMHRATIIGDRPI